MGEAVRANTLSEELLYQHKPGLEDGPSQEPIYYVLTHGRNRLATLFGGQEVRLNDRARGNAQWVQSLQGANGTDTCPLVVLDKEEGVALRHDKSMYAYDGEVACRLIELDGDIVPIGTNLILKRLAKYYTGRHGVTAKGFLEEAGNIPLHAFYATESFEEANPSNDDVETIIRATLDFNQPEKARKFIEKTRNIARALGIQMEQSRENGCCKVVFLGNKPEVFYYSFSVFTGSDQFGEFVEDIKDGGLELFKERQTDLAECPLSEGLAIKKMEFTYESPELAQLVYKRNKRLDQPAHNAELIRLGDRIIVTFRSSCTGENKENAVSAIESIHFTRSPESPTRKYYRESNAA